MAHFRLGNAHGAGPDSLFLKRDHSLECTYEGLHLALPCFDEPPRRLLDNVVERLLLILLLVIGILTPQDNGFSS